VANASSSGSTVVRNLGEYCDDDDDDDDNEGGGMIDPLWKWWCQGNSRGCSNEVVEMLVWEINEKDTSKGGQHQ